MPAAQTMKQRRERLLGKSRPLVRPFDPVADMWVLWAAYDLGSFPALPKGLTIKEFQALVLAQVAGRSKCLVIEDDCRYFKAGRGPACFVVVDNFGWRIEPHVDYFFWATPRMKLRCTVAFLQMTRYSSEIGVCVVRTLERTVPLFRHVQRYVMLSEAGRVPMGDARGDEWIFSIKGARKSPALQGDRNAGTDGVGRGDGSGLHRDGDGGRPAAGGQERRDELPGDAVQGERRGEGDHAGGAGSRGNTTGEVRPVAGRAVEAELAGAGGVN